jgi:Transglycosylase-like domain
MTLKAALILISSAVGMTTAIGLALSAPEQEASPSTSSALAVLQTPSHPVPYPTTDLTAMEQTSTRTMTGRWAEFVFASRIQEAGALAQLHNAAEEQAANAAVQAAEAAAPSPSTASNGPTAPATTTTTPPADSGVDQLLADAPGYVVAAFHCIAYGHESGGDPTAVNPSSGDSGLYQFATGTWLANGGGQFASRALYASVAEQDTVAYWTWQHDGFQPWTGDDECWSGG